MRDTELQQRTTKEVNVTAEASGAYSGTTDLFRLEAMEAYNRFIVELVDTAARKAGVAPNRVLDFGAGIGTLSIQFEKLTGRKPVAFEIDERQAEIIRQRGYETLTCFEDVPGDFDCIFASNVLEHIEDDRAVLEQLRDRLQPRGCLFVLVPAFEFLWTQMDDEVGHFRRYTRSTLSAVVTRSGMRVVECKYCDSLGFVAIAVLKFLQARRRAETTESLRFYDRNVLPLSRLLDCLGFQFLCGRNAYVCAIAK